MSPPAGEALAGLRARQERLLECLDALARRLDGACIELDAPPLHLGEMEAAPERLLGLPEVQWPPPAELPAAPQLADELERRMGRAMPAGVGAGARVPPGPRIAEAAARSGWVGGSGSEERHVSSDRPDATSLDARAAFAEPPTGLRGPEAGGPALPGRNLAWEREPGPAAGSAGPAEEEIMPGAGDPAATQQQRGHAVGPGAPGAAPGAPGPGGARWEERWQSAAETTAGGDGAAPRGAGEPQMEHRRWHRPLELPQAVLVRKYKHAPELGVTERFGRAGLERFAEALRDQVRGAAGAHRVVWRGRVCTVYRGEEHLVVTTPQGRLITAHRATAEQLAYVRAHPEVEP